ncbi:OLC1v1032743C1 [Oldenlandia corymbosa var. corymbosa]|uniref:OLC1v1032743C1 n=1 Tax=Oldenlandia corymbosa var. corymbosa TaxID=529605 RepID=A0AAV1CPE5_OLDCO|nr:OLC1v1032743C1 [Oldenlandia corymbosa var. corymbosa]
MKEVVEEVQDIDEEEAKLQQLRSKATELLLREEWTEAIDAYSHFISLCQEQLLKPHHQQSKLQKSLCLAHSNRAEARFRLKEFAAALKDCDEALKIECAHLKTLLCKGKILFDLNRYGSALECFRAANLDTQESFNFKTLNEYLDRCKKLELLSKTGSFDLSDWILGGFRGKMPELAEYIGGVEIKKSEISGKGLFATKNVECGTLLLVTKAIATERGILPQDDSSQNAQMVMWKNLVDKVVESARKCSRTRGLISMLSDGEEGNDDMDVVPEIDLFRPEAEEERFSSRDLDVDNILSILDVNSLVEGSISSKVLGKNSYYHGVGLWLLASLVNHSCEPNVRRLHIGDHVAIHASRDVKAGEELTFAYFDVLQPFSTREEMSKNWGFICNCRRCKYEKTLSHNQEMAELEMVIGKGLDMGSVVYRLEECMKRVMVRGKGKGYIRASFWGAYEEASGSEKVMRKWGRRIPAIGTVVESVVDAIGSEERIVKLLMAGLKKNGNVAALGGCGSVEMEKAMKLGRGIYGKIMKRQALKNLLQQFIIHEEI